MCEFLVGAVKQRLLEHRRGLACVGVCSDRVDDRDGSTRVVVESEATIGSPVGAKHRPA